MGLFALVLLTCAVLLLVGAEWPRLAARLGSEARADRARRKRKEEWAVIEGENVGDQDAFAASVERDLANLPVIGEQDDRSRR